MCKSIRKGVKLYSGKYSAAFIMPAVGILIVISLVPMGYGLITSLTDANLVSSSPTQFVGLRNYCEILTDKRFWEALLRTILYVFGVVSVELVMGFILAILFQVNFRWKRIIRAVIILPMVATPIAIAFMWRIMYNPNLGILNYLLQLVGCSEQAWVSDEKTALFSVMMVDIWQWTPFFFLILSSGIASLPDDCFEAAEIDGAGFFQTIYKILLPLIKPILSIGILFRVVDSFKTFDTIYVLAGGGPGTATETMNILVYLSGFRHFKMGYACALSILMVYMVLFVCNFIMKRGHFKFE